MAVHISYVHEKISTLSPTLPQETDDVKMYDDVKRDEWCMVFDVKSKGSMDLS